MQGWPGQHRCDCSRAAPSSNSGGLFAWQEMVLRSRKRASAASQAASVGTSSVPVKPGCCSMAFREGCATSAACGRRLAEASLCMPAVRGCRWRTSRHCAGMASAELAHNTLELLALPPCLKGPSLPGKQGVSLRLGLACRKRVAPRLCATSQADWQQLQREQLIWQKPSGASSALASNLREAACGAGRGVDIQGSICQVLLRLL